MTQTALTAAELHALYAPLWAKVPDSEPKELYLAGHVATINGDYVSDSVAAALCRAAVEDWLIEHAEDAWFVVHPPQRGYHEWVVCDGIDGNGTMHAEGPTIHHALVAAAMAVAEAKG